MTYELTVKPTRLFLPDGSEQMYFPTKREELVEAALCKLACDQNQGMYLDDRAGVAFTLRSLQRELSRRATAFHYQTLLRRYIFALRQFWCSTSLDSVSLS